MSTSLCQRDEVTETPHADRGRMRTSEPSQTKRRAIETKTLLRIFNPFFLCLPGFVDRLDVKTQTDRE